MQFLVHPPSRLENWPEACSAYIGGRDGRVYATSIEFDGAVMLCKRQCQDSGRLFVVWPVEGSGRRLIATSSLREQEEPYLLPLELARGKIALVRDQMSTWELSGMTLSDELHTLCKEAQHHFAFAASHQDELDEACMAAEQALQKACAAADCLADLYVEQVSAAHKKRTQHPPALLGGYLSSTDTEATRSRPFHEVFQMAILPISWNQVEPQQGECNWDIPDSQIEWCQQERLLVHGGPLLDFSPQGMPAWLTNWSNDLHNLQSFVCDYVETAVSRYVGKILSWEIAARANTGGTLQLNEEARLAIVARALEVARKVDEEIQLLIRIDQPWGEYQARGQHHLAPLQFVDALLRSGIGLSGVNLEFSPEATFRNIPSRDLLDFSRLIDFWSCLSIPLHVTLAIPSSWNEELQAAWVERFVPMLMVKAAVVGVQWLQFSDATTQEFPHTGLLKEDDSPKLAFQSLLNVSQQFR